VLVIAIEQGGVAEGPEDLGTERGPPDAIPHSAAQALRGERSRREQAAGSRSSAPGTLPLTTADSVDVPASVTILTTTSRV
jgi:hypothetical protein